MIISAETRIDYQFIACPVIAPFYNSRQNATGSDGLSNITHVLDILINTS